MASFERIVFAVLRGGVKGIPLVGGVIEEVLRCLDEERAAAEEAAAAALETLTALHGTPNHEPEAAALEELERLATRGWSELSPAQRRTFEEAAASVVAEREPGERRKKVQDLARDLTVGLAVTGALGQRLSELMTGSLGTNVPIRAGVESVGLQPGMVIERRYRLERELSSGGMAAVWIAHDLKFNRKRAAKIAAATGAAHEAFKARFRREALLGDFLGSQTGIVRAFDWGELPDGVRLFLIMDLIENARPLDLVCGTVEERISRFAQACERVAQIHAKGAIHRDLKPANFLQAPDGTVWLADFGLGKRLGEATPEEPMLTGRGETWGTPCYMSPEQFSNFAGVDARTDVFALGVMLYELLTGDLPYPGQSGVEVQRRQVEVEMGMAPAPTLYGRGRVSAAASQFDALCSSALSIDPSLRPADAATVLAQLRQALSRSEGGESAVSRYRRYRKAAEAGDASAMLNLGGCYAEGRGVRQDHEIAVSWYQKAAEGGDVAAMFELGVCYTEGRGVAQDDGRAITWYRQAAEAGHAAAMSQLGACYGTGKGIVVDLTEAMRWYRLAAEAGDRGGMFALGVYSQSVDFLDADAVTWFRHAAERGHEDAMFHLGVCYAEGRGVAQDQAEAANWYRKAAEAGCVAAMCNLGACYSRGEGVAQDHAEAVSWFRQAAEAGDSAAMSNLGLCYAWGEGVARDLAEAVNWHIKAAEADFAPH